MRVEVRELRRRLDRYFDGEGAEETIRINIPKGSYVPVFDTRAPRPGTLTPETTKFPDLRTMLGIPRIRARIPWATVSWSFLIASFGFCLGLAVEELHSKRAICLVLPWILKVAPNLTLELLPQFGCRYSIHNALSPSWCPTLRWHSCKTLPGKFSPWKITVTEIT